MNDLRTNKIIEIKTKNIEGVEVILYKVENVQDNIVEYWTTYQHYGQISLYIGIKKESYEELNEKIEYNAFYSAYEYYIETETVTD